MRPRVFVHLLLAAAAISATDPALGVGPEVIVSVRDQHLTVLSGQQRRAEYPISTSKFGVGSTPGSFRTPLGIFRVEQKVGARAQPGAVFKRLNFTGEIVSPNAPGRDPIVTRVLCLRGVESQNANSRRRGIFIHGTPEESRIGQPASYGCIRMRSRDVIALFDAVSVGTRVVITGAAVAQALTHPGEIAAEDWFR